MDSRRSGFVDDDQKFRDKHQVLLQEYLVLQKDCVSKKRKLKEAKERKKALLDEIRFLKQRRSFLLRIQSENGEQQQIAVQSQKTDANRDMEQSARSLYASEPSFRNPMQTSKPIIDSMWNSGSSGKGEVGFPPLRIGKKPKDLFANGKRAEKRKISWQDQVSLKA